MDPIAIAIVAIVAYLAGSISFAFLIAKAHGIDLRTVGSGNVGATNCGRALGKKWGLICFLLDVAKGAAPTLAAGAYFGWLTAGIDSPAAAALWLGLGVLTMIGHIFPVWLKFKGGKGVATGFGLILAIYPYLTLPAVAALLLWLLLTGMFRYVSLSGILAALSLPISFAFYMTLAGWPMANVWPFLLVTSLMALLVVIRHKTNITRLIAGTESKVGEKKA